MLRIGISAGKSTRFAMIFVALAMSGCASLYPDIDVADDVVIETPLDTVDVRPLGRTPWKPGLPSVAIVLTGTQPAFADVARELTQRLEDYEIYDLSDGSQPPISVLRLINDSNTGAVVAIGLRAAQHSPHAPQTRPQMLASGFGPRAIRYAVSKSPRTMART